MRGWEGKENIVDSVSERLQNLKFDNYSVLDVSREWTTLFAINIKLLVKMMYKGGNRADICNQTGLTDVSHWCDNAFDIARKTRNLLITIFFWWKFWFYFSFSPGLFIHDFDYLILPESNLFWSLSKSRMSIDYVNLYSLFLQLRYLRSRKVFMI